MSIATDRYDRECGAQTAWRTITTYRRTIHAGGLGFVEDLSVSAAARAGEGDCPFFQVLVPYAGVFNYRVGRKVHLIDVNQILFVTRGEDFSESQPDCGAGHMSIIFNPRSDLLEEITGFAQPGSHACFRAGTRLGRGQARIAAHRLLYAQNVDTLEKDELMIKVLRDAFDAKGALGRPARSHIVDRARQLMHAREGERMSLADIASAVGAAPAYLTQEFTRAFGIPMYKYQLRLRLGRALAELPHTDNITDLALALGFSSHSHFSAAFRAAFGITPSAFRAGFSVERATT